MFVSAVLSIFAVAATVLPSVEVPAHDQRAKAAIERSQRTQATYSLFAWNDVPESGEIKDGWSAEFHRGDLHRVESPRDRLVADCGKMTGTGVSLISGESLTSASVAKMACGINVNKEIQSVEWLGRQQTPFGGADRVRVRDPNSIRTYDVLDNGALAAGTYIGHDGQPQVRNWAVQILDVAPDDIFSEASLAFSAVPARYKRPPAAPHSP